MRQNLQSVPGGRMRVGMGFAAALAGAADRLGVLIATPERSECCPHAGRRSHTISGELGPKVDRPSEVTVDAGSNLPLHAFGARLVGQEQRRIRDPDPLSPVVPSSRLGLRECTLRLAEVAPPIGTLPAIVDAEVPITSPMTTAPGGITNRESTRFGAEMTVPTRARRTILPSGLLSADHRYICGRVPERELLIVASDPYRRGPGLFCAQTLSGFPHPRPGHPAAI